MKSDFITPEFNETSEYKEYLKRTDFIKSSVIKLRFGEKISRRDKVLVAKNLVSRCKKNRIDLLINDDAPLALYVNAGGVSCSRDYLKKLPAKVIKEVARILKKRNFIVKI